MQVRPADPGADDVDEDTVALRLGHVLHPDPVRPDPHAPHAAHATGGVPGRGACHDLAMTLDDVQQLMEEQFGAMDRARGMAASVAWLCEEVGELAQAVRKGTPEQQLHELGDVIAWTASIANQLGLSLDDAMARYRTPS